MALSARQGQKTQARVAWKVGYGPATPVFHYDIRAEGSGSWLEGPLTQAPTLQTDQMTYTWVDGPPIPNSLAGGTRLAARLVILGIATPPWEQDAVYQVALPILTKTFQLYVVNLPPEISYWNAFWYVQGTKYNDGQGFKGVNKPSAISVEPNKAFQLQIMLLDDFGNTVMSIAYTVTIPDNVSYLYWNYAKAYHANPLEFPEIVY